MTTFKATQFYTPENPRQRREVRCVLFTCDNQTTWYDIFYAGLNTLGWTEPRQKICEADVRDQLGHTSPRHTDSIEIHETDENHYIWEIQAWDSKPTTKAEIWEWAEEVSRQAADPKGKYTAVAVLCELLGRRIWERLDQEDGTFELRQEIHDMLYNGFTGKAIVNMGKDELLSEVMGEIIVPSEENFNPNTEKEPCSFEWVRTSRSFLWTGESSFTRGWICSKCGYKESDKNVQISGNMMCRGECHNKGLVTKMDRCSRSTN